MSYQTILLDIAGNVATITINRPEAFNSFNKIMVEEFEALWKELAWNDDVHCCVLRASPGRAFCTGVDVKQSLEPGNEVVRLDNIWHCEDPGKYLGPKSMNCWKPVIAAVHGMAAGGAFYWLNESDIVICSDDATFFDPHVTYGMTSALEPIGMTYKMPLQDVLRMVLLGNDERVSAKTAERIGIVSEVVPLDTLWDRAAELAAIVAAKPPAATAGSVKAIWQSLDLPRSVALLNGLKYCQIGNPVGIPQVDRNALMADKAKRFTLR
ncbi:enoyl-CoA hydratase/isomerase family protein [Novosphingobium sp. Gsoil 351]|uniref:enoyl-CoA hydratase/isomerase family protein n=1 Tax=Novosphingobium sp. Gsoil 351 TaxID=2675225 RepID=UPI0012B4BF14|nr:enoyl-CoA hydratase/isomerase family protein [Novosphingobium sp. Gsoil 351]QGN54213.1 enoyl-CoA hydratase/isomerase family protein [Novosphingobium sp. Gsoil 351]